MTWIPRAAALEETRTAFPELGLDEKILENWTRNASECPPIKQRARLGYDSELLAKWHGRLRDSVVQLDSEDYLRCMVFAIEAYYQGITHADFSRGKQRDAGEFLTNQIQGKLGEIALQKLLSKQGLEIELDFRVEGQVASQDIARISTRARVWNNPAVNVSIKATKLKNIMLAVTETEATTPDRRSEVYVLSQVGLFPDHILRIIKQGNVIEGLKETAKLIPDFAGIPARIAGWVTHAQLTEKPALSPIEIKSAHDVTMAKPNFVLVSGQLTTDWVALKTLIVGPIV